MAVTGWLDRILYRSPFEGGSARRYAKAARPAFGDFDDRLLESWPALAQAKCLLDLGFGTGAFAHRALARHPQLSVLAVDPSREFARPHAAERLHVVRATGEALPLASGSCDAAICLSSLRHVHDRAATLRELRRVVTGSLVIAELDPVASAARIATHADRIGSPILRRIFGPLVVRTAPRRQTIEALARTAGWRVHSRRDDAIQPVYIVELV
ncbi:MAG TPA: class I SAM-dependent methyltransferase [Kofleriaceae bacterium]|nr:class I SAM-dependent methyltransferase [Kofleriaceae bacterium]